MAKKKTKQFLEIEEINEELNADKNPIIFKEKVSGKESALIRHKQIRGTLKGKKYRAYVHVCGHQQNGKNAPCTRELIKEKV